MGINPHRCVLVLGGSFDPVHQGHVALAQHFVKRLQPQELRLVPAGQPWQKNRLIANAEQRIQMLRLAFESGFDLPVLIDQQEIKRAEQQEASFTINTLGNMRAELGPATSLVFLIGADQLRNLSSWRQWRQLFDLAHICAASRPGFALDQDSLDQDVAQEWCQRAGTLEEIRNLPAGKSYLAQGLAWDVSATSIRHELQQTQQTTSLIPPKVLDYIQQHHLYR
ncbi:MAG: nicotinate-nucleotide adenylyltransferase [Undibacterium sp.]|uniref:nicotinate-nucleotide adenylyltransferase n=1 Tax=Undibacterium sp. TaxID=1914977 RepID=UPI00271ECAEC|nr:nicotinate-nucleotide adenylyltransferase [Undibacterium sp.]MDO8652744.1 nicotinate-nucleotide adenylyltransferase [Undibacterium sp.]